MENKSAISDKPRVCITISKDDHYDSKFDFAYMQTQALHKDYTSKVEEVVKNAFALNNIPIDGEFFKKHITRIVKEGDEFDHYIFDFGLKTEKRIISIQRNPTLSFNDNTTKVEAKFY